MATTFGERGGGVEYRPELAGPYSGRGSKVLGYVPRPLRGFVVEAGGMASLLFKILWSAVRHPVGYWGAVRDEMASAIRRATVPMAIAVGGFLIFMALLSIGFFNLLGAESAFGPMLFVFSARNFTMWADSMIVAGVLGAALTADIGARKVREEIDAMEVMGIDPIRDLAVPRLIAITLIMTTISIPSLLVTQFALHLSAKYVGGLSTSEFYYSLFGNLSTIDIVAVVLNSVAIGLMIGTVCAYKGFHASGGGIGLGRAVNQAVVICFVGVWIVQLAYQATLLGLFPQLGEFK